MVWKLRPLLGNFAAYDSPLHGLLTVPTFNFLAKELVTMRLPNIISFDETEYGKTPRCFRWRMEFHSCSSVDTEPTVDMVNESYVYNVKHVAFC